MYICVYSTGCWMSEQGAQLCMSNSPGQPSRLKKNSYLLTAVGPIKSRAPFPLIGWSVHCWSTQLYSPSEVMQFSITNETLLFLEGCIAIVLFLYQNYYHL